MIYKCSIIANIHRDEWEDLYITQEDAINIQQCIEWWPDTSDNTAFTVRWLISLINDMYWTNITSISYEDWWEPLDNDECIWRADFEPTWWLSWNINPLCSWKDIYVISEEPPEPTVARVMIWSAWMIKSIVTPEVVTYDDYSAIQWPCPEWFHLPTASELTALKNTLTTLWIATNEWLQRYLRMPLSWCREDRWWVYWAWTNGNYYSCSVSWNNAIRFFFGNTFTPNATVNRAYWLTIRAFKDVPVVPDENWTELYADPNATWWWLWPSWVYHNSTLWLISFSSDWETWKTIADKNLWATSVYTYWASLTQANCWKYYQWWNNYWFAFTWNVTQSSTQVDTSGYWPGNYYSSSTFITWSWIDWSNPKNDNLWWITTWIIHHEEHIKTNGVYIITPQ